MKTLTCICFLILGLSSATIAESAPDFALSATSPAATVEAGNDISFSINIAASGGPFTQPVVFAAEGLPRGATASFSPTAITLGEGYQSTTMTIHTVEGDSPSGQHVASATLRTPMLAALLMLPFGMGRRTRVRVSCWVAITLVMGGLVGCESGGGAVPLSETVACQTTYLVTVVGTSDSIRHAVSVEITVQIGSGLNT